MFSVVRSAQPRRHNEMIVKNIQSCLHSIHRCTDQKRYREVRTLRLRFRTLWQYRFHTNTELAAIVAARA